MLPEKPWRAETVMQFIGLQLSCFCFGVLTASLLHHFNVAGFRHENDFGNILLGTFCFQGATCILIPFFLGQNEMNWREAFGFHKKNLSRPLIFAVMTLIVVLPIALLLENVSEGILGKIGWQPEEEAAVKMLEQANFSTEIYLAIFAVVIAPVAEEFIFRGILFPFFRQLGHPKLAWVGVSFLFALIHLDPTIFAPLFVLALALTWLYEKTNNLIAPIAAHSLFNALNLLILLHFMKHE
jgi:membrane protease YdiL (CAAX protease family)